MNTKYIVVHPLSNDRFAFDVCEASDVHGNTFRLPDGLPTGQRYLVDLLMAKDEFKNPMTDNFLSIRMMLAHEVGHILGIDHLKESAAIAAGDESSVMLEHHPWIYKPSIYDRRVLYDLFVNHYH